MASNKKKERYVTPLEQPRASPPARTLPFAARLWGSAAFLSGTLLIGSMLSPLDSTSVFDGSAIGQNLFWLLLACLVAVASAVSGWSYRFSGRAWLAVAACLIWFAISTMLAGRENNPRVAWYGFWQVMALASCAFSSRILLSGPRAQAVVLQLLLVGSLALALHGLYQVQVEFPQDKARYRADPEAVLASIPGMEAPPGSPMRMQFEDRLLNSAEPYATFALTNSLATLLSAACVVLFALAMVGLQRVTSHEHARGSLVQVGALVFAIASIGLCWLLTRSNAAYVGLLFGGGCYCLMATRAKWSVHWKLLRVAIASGVVVLLSGFFFLMRDGGQLMSQARKSLGYRFEYWYSTCLMLKDHWLLGVGLGNFQSYYPKYKLPLASETIADPHNWMLDLLVNLSVPIGLAILIWVIRQFVSQPRRRVVDISAPEEVGGRENASSLSRRTTSTREALDAVVARYLTLGGAAGGTVCAVLLGLLSGLNLLTVALTWLPAGLIAYLLAPWIRTLTSSDDSQETLRSQANVRTSESVRSLGKSAAMAMVVCLLASGSWQASGISVPLLMLLVLGSPASLVAAERTGSRYGKWAVCLLPAVGLICFVVQCWRPVTSSWSWMQQAAVATTPERQLQLAEVALAADPLDSEPVGWIAQFLAADAEHADRATFPLAAQKSIDQFDRWLAIDSTKSLNWELAARHVLGLAAKAQNLGLDAGPLLDQSLDYYQEAILRYPTHAGLRAQQAVTLFMAGRYPEAGRELASARQLSDNTPHLDKKLQSQLLWLPLLPNDYQLQLDDAPPWLNAEPVLGWLRKQLDGMSTFSN